MITDYSTLEEAQAVQGGDVQILYPAGMPAIYRVRTGEDAPPPPPTPTVLSARQFWLAIEIMGYGPAMDALVAQLPKLSQIAINKATEFDRTFPQFVELSKYIGTPEQIAALFEYGATL